MESIGLRLVPKGVREDPSLVEAAGEAKFQQSYPNPQLAELVVKNEVGTLEARPPRDRAGLELDPYETDVMQVSGFFPQSRAVWTDRKKYAKLVETFKTGKTVERWVAAEDLGNYPEAIDLLCEALPNADSDLTLHIVKALAQIKDKKASMPLLEKWKHAAGGAPGTRYVPDALAAIGDRSVVPALVKPLTNCRFDYRSHIVYALGLLGGPTAENALRDLAKNDPFPAVRAQAQDALEKRRDRHAADLAKLPPNTWVEIKYTTDQPSDYPDQKGRWQPVGWNKLVYDPDGKRVLFYDRWIDKKHGGYTIYGNCLFAFDPAAGKVAPIKIDNWTKREAADGGYRTLALSANDEEPTPCPRHVYHAFEYVPALKAVFICNGANQSALRADGKLVGHDLCDGAWRARSENQHVDQDRLARPSPQPARRCDGLLPGYEVAHLHWRRLPTVDLRAGGGPVAESETQPAPAREHGPHDLLRSRSEAHVGGRRRRPRRLDEGESSRISRAVRLRSKDRDSHAAGQTLRRLSTPATWCMTSSTSCSSRSPISTKKNSPRECLPTLRKRTSGRRSSRSTPSPRTTVGLAG